MDLDQDAAVGQRVTGDADLGLRRGERRRVLQQLGEEVHKVVDDAAGDLGRGDRGQFDALVLLHLGGGGTEHVDQRNRAGPPAARLLAREDEKVLAVPAHTGRQVVQLEEGGQLVRVGLAGLQLGDERELTLDEALAAAREVGEHRVDVASQQGLLGGEADRLAVHVVEGRGHLADLVLGVDTDRLDGGVDVLRVRLGELLDQLGQTVLGDPGRGVLQSAQRADHGAGHDEGADERDTEDDQDQRTVDDRVTLRLVAQFTGLALHLAEQGGLDGLHGVDADRVVVGPVEVRALLLGAKPVLVVQRTLGVFLGRRDGRVAAVERGGQLGGRAARGLVDRLERQSSVSPLSRAALP